MIDLNALNVDKIRSFEVSSEQKQQRFPNNRLVTIEMENGTTRTIKLENYKIHILITSIAKEKLKNIWWKSENNFNEFGEDPRTLNFFYSERTRFPTADEIIEEIFSKNVLL